MSAIMFDSCIFTHQFKLNFFETQKVAIGHSVSSEDISAGGHLWRIKCYPRGSMNVFDGNYVSIFLKLLSKSKSEVQAIFEASLLDRDAALSLSHLKSFVHEYTPDSQWGWHGFVERSVVKSLYVTNGSFIIVAAVKVVRDDPLDVPTSDIGSHLGSLLECTNGGSDVSFVVDGEKFLAHRTVLAARSPVFKAQLLGSMADAKMPSITLHDIAPVIFKVMLRFIYTDDFPDDDEFGDSSDDMFRHLLAAADRFALDRLKVMCARKLWDNVLVDSVAATLMCAETHNCTQLKKKCIEFIVEEKNFKKVVLTDGFIQLVQQFPSSILDELRKKVGT